MALGTFDLDEEFHDIKDAVASRVPVNIVFGHVLD